MRFGTKLGAAINGLIVATTIAASPLVARAQDSQPAASDAAESAPSQSDDTTANAPEANAPETSAPEQPLDWSALDWDAPSLAGTDAQKTWNGSKPSSSADATWDRKANSDGSTALSLKKQLPTSGFDSKVGVDVGLAEPQTTLKPEQLATGSAPANSGAAWANMSMYGASIDARLNPVQDQATLGTSLRKSMPLGDEFSVTLQNGVSVTDTFVGHPALVPVPTNPAGRVYSTDNLARFTILPSDTSLLAGTKLSSSDDKWLHSIGAEQKIFGGFNVTGTLSETTTGGYDKNLSAGFKKSW